MDHPKFVIEASDAESMAKSSGFTLKQLLPNLVVSAQTLARVPISNFHVGAVGVGPSGRIFFGVNLEFPGLPLHHSVHAEQFLVTNLFINGETNLDCLAVSAAPCGHCRQFFQEIRAAPDIKLLITLDEEQDFKPLSQFLSHRFGPHDLLPDDIPLLLEPRHNGLHFSGEINNSPTGICNNGYHPNEKLKCAALEAANKSHAPYSGSPSGVALIDSDGKIYKGSYIESAAYNPSMGPVQAALVSYVAGGGGDYQKIVGAALVEKEGAVVKQEQTAQLLLQSISSQCDCRRKIRTRIGWTGSIGYNHLSFKVVTLGGNSWTVYNNPSICSCLCGSTKFNNTAQSFSDAGRTKWPIILTFIHDDASVE